MFRGGEQRATECTINLFGYQLPLRVARSPVHKLLCLERERFVDERYLVLSLLRPGFVCVDVGANIGYILLLLQKGIRQSGTVVCIEPVDENIEELRACIAANGFTNVEVLQAAAGDSQGGVCLQPGLNGRVVDSGPQRVRQITLDSLRTMKPDFVKIDVEGYEGFVLRGAREMIAACTPNLFVEMHPALVPDPIELREIITYLRSVYREVRHFEYRTPRTMAGKLATRYGFISQAPEIHEEAGLLTACENGQRSQPFWTVCVGRDIELNVETA